MKVITPTTTVEASKALTLLNRANYSGMTVDDYIAFCIDRTLRTTVDDLAIELQQFKEKNDIQTKSL